jgi:hypothetical protein
MQPQGPYSQPFIFRKLQMGEKRLSVCTWQVFRAYCRETLAYLAHLQVTKKIKCHIHNTSFSS